MPSWKVHLVFNLILVFIWIRILLNYGFINDYLLMVSLVFLSSFLSVFPDIDTPKSKIRDYFSIIITSIILLYLILNLTINPFLSLFVTFIFLYFLFRFFPVKHRGITHKFEFSILFSFIMTLILWFMLGFSLTGFMVYFLVIITGYLSHIFLDKLT